MSTKTAYAPDTSKAEVAASTQYPHLSLLDSLIRSADRFGWPTILLVLVLYWARTDVVKPLLDANSGFMNSIVDSHRNLVQEVKSLGSKLDILIDVSSKK